MKIKCKKCLVEFDSKTKSQQYCSEYCRKKSYLEIRICEFCKKEYETSHYSKSRFCSNSCHTKSMAKPENRTIRNCVACGKEFETWSKCKPDHKFCSRTCARTVQNNKSKWYKINDIMCQGTYELAFIDWCVKTQLDVIFDRKSILYIDDSNIERSYHPDYWVPSWNSYIDIKSHYTEKFSVRKFELLSEQHPEISIKVLNDDDLTKLGVDLSYNNRSNLEMQYSVDKSCTIVVKCDNCDVLFQKHYRSKTTSCSKKCANERIHKKYCDNFELEKIKLKSIIEQFHINFTSINDAEFALFLLKNNIIFEYEYFYKSIDLKSGKHYYYRANVFNISNNKKILVRPNRKLSNEFIEFLELTPELIVIETKEFDTIDIEELKETITHDRH